MGHNIKLAIARAKKRRRDFHCNVFCPQCQRVRDIPKGQEICVRCLGRQTEIETFDRDIPKISPALQRTKGIPVVIPYQETWPSYLTRQFEGAWGLTILMGFWAGWGVYLWIRS